MKLFCLKERGRQSRISGLSNIPEMLDFGMGKNHPRTSQKMRGLQQDTLFIISCGKGISTLPLFFRRPLPILQLTVL